MLKAQAEIFARLHNEVRQGKKFDQNWWKDFELLVLIKEGLDNARLSLFDPSSLHKIWMRIKVATRWELSLSRKVQS